MNYYEKYLKYKNKYINLKNYIEIQKGGRILGRGAWGEVSDLCLKDNDSDKDTFCKQFVISSTIKFYTLNDKTDEEYTSILPNPVIIDDDKHTPLNFTQSTKKDSLFISTQATVDEKDLFIRWINDTGNKVVKKFKKKDKFEDELKEVINVKQIYRQNPDMIIIHTPTINGKIIYGVEITNNSKTYYILFGNKCDTNLQLNDSLIISFIEQILESIKIINTQDYYHNDIKLSNIIKCHDRYNLIDWGASKIVKNIDDCRKRGDPILSSPMKLYIVYSSNILLRSQNIPSMTLFKFHISKEEWKFIKENTNIKEEIKSLFAKQHIKFTNKIKTLNKRDILQYIYTQYHKSFDIYMFGITLFHAIYKYDLFKDKKYHRDILLDYINKLISFDEQLDINYAIEEFNELKNNLLSDKVINIEK